MLAYALRRIVMIVPMVLGVTLLLFLVARLLPGDPVLLAAGPNATPELLARMREEFGLDRALPVQYWTYLTGLLSGDWGMSVFTRRPVFDDLLTFLPATLELVFSALLLAIVFGIPLGLLTAWYRNGVVDYLGRTVALGGIAMPRFFLGILLQMSFAAWLNWLPLSGRFPLIDTSTAPKPTSVGSTVISGASCASEGLARTNTAMSDANVAAITAAIAPMRRAPRLPTQWSFIERLRFYGLRFGVLAAPLSFNSQCLRYAW